MMGNKGACAVRLRVHDSGLCFVNVHLRRARACLEGTALVAFLAALPAPLFPPPVQAICDVADPKVRV